LTLCEACHDSLHKEQWGDLAFAHERALPDAVVDTYAEGVRRYRLVMKRALAASPLGLR
jgi:hypothetical protein